MRHTEYDSLARQLRRIAAGVILAIGAMLLTTSPAHAIIGGDFDEENMFNNVGAIAVTKTPTTFPGVPVPQTISSGTLIHPRVLLTAGHTVAFMQTLMNNGGLTIDDFAVSFDPVVTAEDHDMDTFIGVETIIAHESFRIPERNHEAHDVGVLILSEPAPTEIPLVTLAEEGLLDRLFENGELSVDGTDGTPILFVGYGATDEDRPYTTQVLPSGLRHSAFIEFQALRQHDLFVSSNFAQGETSGATGDSGGPAFWMDVDPQTGEPVMKQVALVSWGDSANVEHGASARLDVPEVLSFIDDMKNLADSLPE